jgi:hypothetical protein
VHYKPYESITRYEDREQIERMFSCLKRRGFNIEDTHMTDPKKLSMLLGVVTIAFCWAYKMGDYIDEEKEIKRKNHGRRVRSVFKTGHVYLRNLLASIKTKAQEYTNILGLIFRKDYSLKSQIKLGFL